MPSSRTSAVAITNSPSTPRRNGWHESAPGPDKLVPVAPDQALVKLLVACKGTTYKARRDTAIIRVLFDCGVRVAECAGLAVEDVDLETLSVRVYGKGRMVFEQLPVETAGDLPDVLGDNRQRRLNNGPRLV